MPDLAYDMLAFGGCAFLVFVGAAILMQAWKAK